MRLDLVRPGDAPVASRPSGDVRMGGGRVSRRDESERVPSVEERDFYAFDRWQDEHYEEADEC